MQQRNSDAYRPDEIRARLAGTSVRARIRPGSASGDDTSSTRSLLLLHGWGSHSEHIWPLVSHLPSDLRIVAPDLPGHGDSPPPPGPWGVPEHIELLHELIDACIPGKFTLVGHSNGGRLGLRLAAGPDRPEGLDSLVLISPSGIRRRPTPTVRLKRLAAGMLKAPFRLMPGALREPGLDWLRHSLLWKALGSSDYRALDGVMRETFVRTVNHHVEKDLAAINVPVLVFRGDGDRAVTQDQMDRLMQGLPDAGLHVIERAGHYAQIDRPDIIAGGIRTLLKDLKVAV